MCRRFQCPIAGLEYNGRFRFFALRTCGHVLSARALKEVTCDSTSCLVCHMPYVAEDLIILSGADEEVEDLRARMLRGKASKAKTKSAKKEKRKLECVEEVPSPNTRSEVGDGSQMVDADGERKTGGSRRVGGMVVKAASLEEPTSVVRPKGSDRMDNPKRLKTVAPVPVGATEKVYSSIFLSSRKEEMKETYMCRNLPLGRN